MRLSLLPDKVSLKETKENLRVLYKHVVYPLSLNSEMALYYYNKSRHHETVAECVTSKHIYQRLLDMVNKCNAFTDYKKRELAKMITNTVNGGKEIEWLN